jgi:hypothetical protein
MGYLHARDKSCSFLRKFVSYSGRPLTRSALCPRPVAGVLKQVRETTKW